MSNRHYPGSDHRRCGKCEKWLDSANCPLVERHEKENYWVHPAKWRVCDEFLASKEALWDIMVSEVPPKLMSPGVHVNEVDHSVHVRGNLTVTGSTLIHDEIEEWLNE